jgi:hypothetical protein
MLLALFVSLIPASSFAGVFISVGFAPPALPVYEQPPCPEPGLMWTPGYWAYGEDGYYWVPGAWVPAPYEGALWTPGYWGWGGGLYAWHPGYWGRHVGYYGGVNYGFGYMGVGFVGGGWRGHMFAYNTAVVHVNTTVIHNTYIDRTVVERNTIVNDRHVAFSGGPGGIRHDPAPEERLAEHDQHMARTSFQTQHMNEAMHDHSAYFKNNSGRPSNMATPRPLGGEHAGGNAGFNASHGNENFHRQPESHGAPQYRAPQEHNAPRPEEHNGPRPEQRNAPRPQEHSNPHPEGHGHDEGHGHGR